MSGIEGNAGAARVDRDLAFEIAQFLYREARLLDAERYDEWLAMMAPGTEPMPPSTTMM